MGTVLLALALAGPAVARAEPIGVQAMADLDAIARAYVQLSLEAGEHEEGYVDAYYGPPEWAAAAKAHPRPVDALIAEAGRLRARALAVDPAALDSLARKRRAFLAGQLQAAQTRLAMHQGTHFDFDDEAFGLFGVRVAAHALTDYDTQLAQIDQLLPGQGMLWERVDGYRNRFNIPKDRLEAVMQASIAECRRRTLMHLALPADEHFTLGLVTGKPWGGYNYYQGNDTSVIQINTDLPIPIDRAVDLGCHEGYPGHHVYNMLLEQKLARARGWVEFTIYPLYGPQSLIAEGSANYGIDLAFPGDERAQFEQQVLYPLAGLDPAEAVRYARLGAALKRLSGAGIAIARDFVDGRIDRATATALLQKYSLTSAQRAGKALDFAQHYRSYVVNYGLGLELVRDHVESVGADAGARWAQMTRILSEPTTPADLVRTPQGETTQ